MTDARNARHSIRVAFSEPTNVPKDWYRNTRTQVRVGFQNAITSARLIGGFQTRVLSGPWGGNAKQTQFQLRVLHGPPINLAKVKVWDGGAWIDSDVKLWNGTAWVNAVAIKFWNGTAWVEPP